MSEYSSDYRSKKPFATTSSFASPLNHETFATGLSQGNSAEGIYHKLVECIFDFERKLDDDHEIGARLLAFGSSVSFYLQDVGCYNPDIITLSGKDEHGEKLQLVQHASQLSVIFIEKKKLGAEAERIGFKLKRKIKAES